MSPGPEPGFAAFYEQLHDGAQSAFAWQIRLAEELAAGKLFASLDAPTGSGKTTVVECYVYALAQQAQLDERRIPLRLFWVVDRRAVVDQVFDHISFVAERIAKHDDGSDALAWVRSQLLSLSLMAEGPGSAPLHVDRWRGGIASDRATLAPIMPAVIASTVDQVGSKLLFRGYGTSPRSRPLEAALTGTDSLIILDEAHIAQPFLETAQAVREHQLRPPDSPVRPLVVAPLSATLSPGASGPVFRLTAEELAEPALAPRLRACKEVRLVRAADRVKGLATEARALAADGPSVIGVVANLIEEARQVYEDLRKRHRAILIIGPSPPIRRDAVLSRIPGRGERDGLEEPLFVVATQTIEVGLDLDFDALVTAAAPFSSLVQRLGRLDRAGSLERSTARIVLSRQKDHVYGEASTETFEWLDERADNGLIELGPNELERLRSQNPPAGPEPPRAPILAAHHVEALAQTSQDPQPSPEIGYFLHGDEGARDADVQICWRADLRSESSDTEWLERVLARPPHRDELISLPVWVLRSWMRGRSVSFSDIESAPLGDELSSGDGPRFVRVPRRDPDGALQAAVTTNPAEIQPGEVIVVPSDLGGADEFGWSFDSHAPVPDLGSLARGRPRILVDPTGEVREVAGAEMPDELAATATELIAELRAETLIGNPYERLREALVEWGGDGRMSDPIADLRREILSGLSDLGVVIPVPAEQPSALVLQPRPPAKTGAAAAPALAFKAHTERVEQLARGFATLVGFPDEIVESVVVAARYHDAGKLDPRFQAWLNGGSPADAERPLAKSATGPSSPDWRAAQIAAGWPARKRHENLSALLLCKVFGGSGGDMASAGPGLAIHLVATHHGQNRPFRSNEAHDSDPIDVSFASFYETDIVLRSDDEIPWAEHASNYAQLTHRFGEWGLAAVETVLVSADRIASAEVGE